MSFSTMEARVNYLGGSQLNRINKNKLESFRWVLKNDYNTRKIKVENKSVWPCLINTASGGLKTDYDKKCVSVEFDSGLEAGDTFECLDDGTHWMVYLPVLTETAYLRSEIIRCRYQMTVNDKEYWVYFQGPTETDLRWFIKNKINVNELNLSGTIYIKNDDNTKKYFKRFTRIKIDGHIWEVQVTDSISVPGIIELEVQEYYDNSIEELPEILDDPNNTTKIAGDMTVKQDTINGYAITEVCYDPSLEWSIKNNDRVEIEEVLEDGRICKVKVHDGAVKTFDVCYGDESLTVTIDWVEPTIQGPQIVYPYDVHTYWIKNIEEGTEVAFSIDDDSKAKITNVGNDYCEVEIVTSKKGSFNLSAKHGETEITLPVKIKSL
jgi:hypothetical protein